MPRLPHAARTRDGGFALIAVLWVMVGLSALALAGTLAARDAVSAATNRAELARAAWGAEDCLERARAAVSAALAGAGEEGPDAPTWRALDRAAGASPLVRGCDLALVPAGRRVNLNAADGDMLRRLFVAAGAGGPRADSLADALLDWRDADDRPRPFGIEAAGYRAAGRPLPRNDALADERELAEVRGFERPGGVDTLLTVEPGRVFLDRAPPAVLASLPGMTPEVVARLQQLRSPTGGAPALAVVADALSPPARDALLRAYQDLASLTAPVPDAWIVTARGRSGTPALTAAVQVRLVRAGARAAVVRRRSWIE
ncbi:MAG TPA: hypothetical protein VGO40_01695 [Longimicrobium sp.]|nr:hypothetical protein [Longimicrobium sp.]